MSDQALNLLDLAANTAVETAADLAKDWVTVSQPALIGALAAPAARLIFGGGSQFAVDFAVALVKTLLRQEDKLKAIHEKLDRVLGEPFESAIHVLAVLQRSAARSDPERAFVTSRLADALSHLDRAASLASPKDLPVIWLLQGAVALRIPGGGIEAAVRFEHLAFACESAAETARLTIGPAEAGATKQQALADSIADSGAHGNFAGGGLAMWDSANDMLRKGNALKSVRQHREIARAAAQSIESLLASTRLFRHLAALSRAEPAGPAGT